VAGRLVYFEVRAGDSRRARRFYEGVFDWRFGETEEGLDYTMFDADGGPGGGLYASSGGERGLLVYFAVDDIDAAIDRVNARGGEAQPRQAIPFTGWYARCLDTEGNAFSLFQRDPSVTGF
jgi:predicted enzyme related to lactoylglutathione lyase